MHDCNGYHNSVSLELWGGSCFGSTAWASSCSAFSKASSVSRVPMGNVSKLSTPKNSKSTNERILSGNSTSIYWMNEILYSFQNSMLTKGLATEANVGRAVALHGVATACCLAFSSTTGLTFSFSGGPPSWSLPPSSNFGSSTMWLLPSATTWGTNILAQGSNLGGSSPYATFSVMASSSRRMASSNSASLNSFCSCSISSSSSCCCSHCIWRYSSSSASMSSPPVIWFSSETLAVKSFAVSFDDSSAASLAGGAKSAVFFTSFSNGQRVDLKDSELPFCLHRRHSNPNSRCLTR